MDQPVAAEQPQPQPIAPSVVTEGGITVESNTGTQESLRAELDGLNEAIERTKGKPPKPTPEPKPKDEPSPEPAPEPAPAAESDAADKPRNRREDPKVAVQSAVAKQREAERRAEAAERELAALKAPKAEPPKAPVASPDDPEPLPTAFAGGEYDPAYLKASAKWEARQEFKAQQAEIQKQSARENQIRNVEAQLGAFSQRLGAKMEERVAFLETIDPAITGLRTSGAQAILAPTEPLTASNAIADCISNSQHPKAMLQHLNDNKDFFQRISTLHPVEAIWEMGKIEARLEAAHSGPAKTPQFSKATPPMKPVGGAPVVSDDDLNDEMSDEEFVARRNRQEIAARRRGRG